MTLTLGESCNLDGLVDLWTDGNQGDIDRVVVSMNSERNRVFTSILFMNVQSMRLTLRF